MNTLRNKVSLIGRLGANPEFTTLKSGNSLAKFSIATNEGYKDKSGEWVDVTQWHSIEAWGKLAELISKHLEKGTEVMLEGRLNNSTYETKSGEKRYATSIVANDFLKINTKSETK